MSSPYFSCSEMKVAPGGTLRCKNVMLLRAIPPFPKGARFVQIEIDTHTALLRMTETVGYGGKTYVFDLDLTPGKYLGLEYDIKKSRKRSQRLNEVHAKRLIYVDKHARRSET